MRVRSIVGKGIAMWSLVFSLAGCMSPVKLTFRDYEQIAYSDRTANATSLSKLVMDLYASDFINKSCKVKKEFFNNAYSISFDDKKCKIPQAVGCYIKETQEVSLRDFTFSHLKAGANTRLETEPMRQDISGILLHEVMHDLFSNILTFEEQLNFSLESEIWYRTLNKVDVGYKKLSNIRQFYRDEQFFGTELYCRIIEMVYNKEIKMPLNLKLFYKDTTELYNNKE